MLITSYVSVNPQPASVIHVTTVLSFWNQKDLTGFENVSMNTVTLRTLALTTLD